ncbi:MAG TPA: GNAT family N-acetyltransferase [Thermoleophilia bacterium]|nr:GNAT family N-acetyltransferase [Thermoleophilia bacterium]
MKHLPVEGFLSGASVRHDGVDAHALWRLYAQGASQLWSGAERGESRLARGAALAMSGVSHVEMNFGIVDAAPGAECRLREFVACLRERRLPGYLVLGDAVADELAPTAHDLGLVRRGTTPLLLSRGADPPRPPGEFRARRLTAAADVPAFTEVVARAWSLPVDLAARAFGPAALGAPGVELFLLNDVATGAPVSAAVSTATGGAVGVWAVSTVPQQRGRGAARALLAALLRHHRDTAAAFYLTAAGGGRRLYEELGFETVAEGVAWDVTLP